MVGTRDRMARQKQGVVLHAAVCLQIRHRWQIQAAAVLKNVTAKDHPTVAVPAVVVADYREATLGVKADLCVRPGPVIHQTVDSGNDGPVIAAIADISTAAELLRSVQPGSQAHHG